MKQDGRHSARPGGSWHRAGDPVGGGAPLPRSLGAGGRRRGRDRGAWIRRRRAPGRVAIVQIDVPETLQLGDDRALGGLVTGHGAALRG